MSRAGFNPTHVLVLMVGLSLRIQIVTDEYGNYKVRKALFNDEENRKLSRSVSESTLHMDSYGRMYFYHNKERYFLSDFSKMPE